jgi:hypothetical protein
MKLAIVRAYSCSHDERNIDYQGHCLLIQVGKHMLEITLTKRSV